MKRKYILPLFLVFQIIFLKVVAFFPEAVEYLYSNGFYVATSKVERFLLGWVPFSVGDILYIVLIIYLLKVLWKSRKTWRSQWKDNVLSVIGGLSIFYCIFHVLWALNYYRMPLFEKMHLKRDYTEQQLLQFTQKLITKTNALHLAITHNETQKVNNPYTMDSLFKISQHGYDALAKEHSFFRYTVPSRKKSLFSYPLTYMGFGGYLNPFTNEAQVNYLPPKYNAPATICHEMAHQIGYASESECNFIGFLSSTKNDNLYFKYGGYTFALRYCLATIGAKDETRMRKLLKTIHPGILQNFQESEDFWKDHRTFIDTAFEIFYDRFLKMNQQKDGMESYSKFVDLLVNYYGDKSL